MLLTKEQKAQLLTGLEYCFEQASNGIATIYEENLETSAEHRQQLFDIEYLKKVVEALDTLDGGVK